MLHDLNLRGSELPETENRKSWEKTSEGEKIEPDELQIRAIIEAVNSGLLIITYGPGTGKDNNHQHHHPLARTGKETWRFFHRNRPNARLSV